MTATVAEVMVSTLKASGVRRVYGLPGDSLNGFTDALRRDGEITWEHVRHEEAAGFAAAAEAALTGDLAVCAGSCGPGNPRRGRGGRGARRGVPRRCSVASRSGRDPGHLAGRPPGRGVAGGRRAGAEQRRRGDDPGRGGPAAAARLEHGKLQMAGRLERMAPGIPAPGTGPSARRLMTSSSMPGGSGCGWPRAGPGPCAAPAGAITRT